MTLITEDYLEQQRALHAKGNYGVVGDKYAPMVREVVNAAHIRTILDYGAGQCRLARALPDLDVRCYDPAIPELSAAPEPADLVTCTDVLEHVEPDCLAAVLDDIRRCSLRHVFLVIATRPAAKFLPDGRNAHLIQGPLEWWMPKLRQRWSIDLVHAEKGEFVVCGSVAA